VASGQWSVHNCQEVGPLKIDATYAAPLIDDLINRQRQSPKSRKQSEKLDQYARKLCKLCKCTRLRLVCPVAAPAAQDPGSCGSCVLNDATRAAQWAEYIILALAAAVWSELERKYTELAEDTI